MDSLIVQAQSALREKKVELARLLFSQQLEKEPTNALAHQGLAECLFSLDNYEVALNHCNAAINLNKNLSVPYLLIGYIQSMQGDSIEAENNFKQAINNEPDSLACHVYYGNFLLDLGRVDESISSLQRAVEIEPSYWMPHVYLTNAYMSQFNPKAALGEAKVAFGIHKSLDTLMLIFAAYLQVHKKWLLPTLSMLPIFILILPLAISMSLLIMQILFAILSTINQIKIKDRRKELVINWVVLLLFLIFFILVRFFIFA